MCMLELGFGSEHPQGISGALQQSAKEPRRRRQSTGARPQAEAERNHAPSPLLRKTARQQNAAVDSEFTVIVADLDGR